MHYSIVRLKKQSTEIFCKSFRNFTGKRLCIFIKMRLQHRCSFSYVRHSSVFMNRDNFRILSNTYDGAFFVKIVYG